MKTYDAVWNPIGAKADGSHALLHPDRLDQPLRWRKPRRIFVCSLADLFHDDVPDSYIAKVFAAMTLSPQHTFQVLTKQPERMRDWMTWALDCRISEAMLDLGYDESFRGEFDDLTLPLPNVWLGVSVENARYTWRADVLREIPAAVRFISAEPLLGSLSQSPSALISERHANGVPGPDGEGRAATAKVARPLDLSGIDWIIVGGESGPGARPMHPEWAREIRDACLAQRGWAVAVGNGPRDPLPGETAFFHKQNGEWLPHGEQGVGGVEFGTRIGDVCLSENGERYTVDRDYVCAPNESDGTWLRRVGKKAAGRLLDGRTWDEMPEGAA